MNIKLSKFEGERIGPKHKYLDFWTRFKEYALVNGYDANIKPPSENWYEISVGHSRCGIRFVVYSKKKPINCSLYIWRDKNLFNFLKERKEEIERDASKNFIWEKEPEKTEKTEIKVEDVFDESKDEEYFSWFYDMNNMFRDVFTKYLEEYKEKKYNQ